MGEVTKKPWGEYEVLHEYDNIKIKELRVNPNSCLSLQRHKYRSEIWMVKSGAGTVVNNSYAQPLYVGIEPIKIQANSWHQLINGTQHPLVITEIQYGEKCEEDDIERLA